MDRFLRIFTLLAAVILACSCADRIKDIKLNSCSVSSFASVSLRSAEGTLLLEIDNPAMQFTISEIEGTLFYRDEELASYTAEPLTIKARCTESYSLKCRAELSPEMPLAKLMGLAVGLDPEYLTTDIRAKAKLKNGISRKLDFKSLPVKALLGKMRSGQKAETIEGAAI